MADERKHPLSHLSLFLLLATILTNSGSILAAVEVHEDTVVIPTYLAGDPEPNPMFFFGRQSQGAEGRIYPYPLYDALTGEKADKAYTLVTLENEYVRIGVLPEIGGRIFEGLDKTNGYNFFYRQHVIKPALIGLIGAWISGGVEWNIPHHHRATTFIPVQHSIEENPDGSKTVWVGELEIRHRMRWAVGYTLRPGSNVLEASVRIVNRTPVLQSMLCFANVAVHANENYQVIFPPSTQYVTYHSKREFTTWPIATGRFSGANFGDGTDASWYKNHDSSMSMFAWNYCDDFFAGYDHGQNAGTMSVANHNLVPGKKFWTWGNGANGRVWDRTLTDDDGPYIELMVGAYSDNQPDYSWLGPYEVRSFEMYWYPFQGIGGVKKANLDAAVNLEANDGVAQVGFCVTSARPNATVILKAGDAVLLEETVDIDPGRPYTKEINISAGIDEHDLRASLSVDGKELVAYSPVRLEEQEMPEPVQGPARPDQIETNEELYLAGLRIEQFYDPSRDPEPYWEDALRRDPGDVRVNTALGVRQLKQARYAQAEAHFRKALERSMDNYTSPLNGDALYYLGVALKAQGKTDEAYDSLYKATWSMAWRAPAYYALAEIACGRGDMSAALDLANDSLISNAQNIRALNLKAAVLRHLGRTDEALAVLASAAHETDPLDVRAMAERWLASRDSGDRAVMVAAMNNHPATAQETAAEYMNAGLWDDGMTVLTQAAAEAPDSSHVSPMVYYYLAYFADKVGQAGQAAQCCRLAQQMSADYVFPFQDEAVAVLDHAMAVDAEDGRAPYYLGNLLYDWQPDRAVGLWEKSVALDSSLAIPYRNLAVAYSHEDANDATEKAMAALEKAVSMPTKYAMHFAELDEMYQRAGVAPEKRLALMEANSEVVAERDDALSRMIELKVLMGKYDEAIDLMIGRSFEVWEGGTLTVAGSWADAHLLRGRQRLFAGRYREALADFQAAGQLPDNLPSSRGVSGRDAEIAYCIGIAYEGLDDTAQAREAWTRASAGSAGGARSGWRGGFGGAEQYYRALALGELGEGQRATEIFEQMIATDINQTPGPARGGFGGRQLRGSREAEAHYSIGLGYLGLGQIDTAKEHFNEALKTSPDHLGARAMLAQ